MLRIFSQRLRLVKDADSGYTQNDLFRVISEELVCHNARLPPPAEANQEWKPFFLPSALHLKSKCSDETHCKASMLQGIKIFYIYFTLTPKLFQHSILCKHVFEL